MAPRSTSIAAGVLLAVLATGALGGCSLFSRPEPPSSVVDAVDAALADLLAIEGVATATGYASPIDSMSGGDALDDPDNWIARFSITAAPAPDLSTLARDIGATMSTTRGTVSSAANLEIAAEGTSPATALDFSTEPSIRVADMVAAATVLRGIDGAERVSVSTYPWPARVELDSSRPWADAAAELRATPGFGSGGLHAVSLSSPLDDDGSDLGSVTFDTVSPSPALIARFGELAGAPGIRSGRLDGVRPVDLVDDAGLWRPSLSLTAGTRAQAQEIAAMLVALPDSESGVPGVPRPRFTVETADYSCTVSGFVGLALDAMAPGDGVPTPPRTPVPPPVDPQVAAERLEAGRVLVSSLLDEAGVLAGVRGTPTIETVPCADGRGAQVQGSVVVPIFEISDSADDAFATITGAWIERGFRYADRAMGTDAYAAAGFEILTIRGTAEGIRITAAAECSARG